MGRRKYQLAGKQPAEMVVDARRYTGLELIGGTVGEPGYSNIARVDLLGDLVLMHRRDIDIALDFARREGRERALAELQQTLESLSTKGDKDGKQKTTD